MWAELIELEKRCFSSVAELWLLLLLFVLVCVCVCVCIMNVLGQWWAMDSVCAGLYDLCQV